MVETFRDKCVSWLSIASVVVIFIGGVSVVYPSFQRGQALKAKDAELSERIDEKKREIALLVENQRRFRVDSDFVEQIARQNRRVFPGELVFIFEDQK